MKQRSESVHTQLELANTLQCVKTLFTQLGSV